MIMVDESKLGKCRPERRLNLARIKLVTVGTGSLLVTWVMIQARPHLSKRCSGLVYVGSREGIESHQYFDSPGGAPRSYRALARE